MILIGIKHYPVLIKKLFKYLQFKQIQMNCLTDLQIEVTPNDTSSISFALLQGHLRQLFSSQIEKNLLVKMNLVLFELFKEHSNMQAQLLQAKNALLQCNDIIKDCRDDRQQIFKLSQDRLNLIKQLKETTDQTYELLQQNEKQKKMVIAYEQLNQLLNKRYFQMEEQLNKLKNTDGVKDSVKHLQSSYNNMVHDNLKIQQQMVVIGKQAEEWRSFSLPIRVVNVAFNSNRSLKELVMRQCQQQLGLNQELRELFMTFDFGQGSK